MDPEHSAYFDAHTHLLDFPSSSIDSVIDNALQHGFKKIMVNTTTSIQYDPLLRLAQKYPQIIVSSFGVHPLFIDAQEKINGQSGDTNWLEQLKIQILRSQSYCVGEIGIDFRTKELERIPKEKQMEYFTKQLELGVELDRPVTIHCVRAYGEILKCLKTLNSQIVAPKNPHLIMHSYGGSKDITKSLLKLKNLRIYFSLSLRGSPDLCEVIPMDRLLLETDAPCQNNPQLLEKTQCTHYNTYHFSTLEKLKKIDIKLYEACFNKEVRENLKREEVSEQAYSLMTKVVSNETSEPTNILAHIKILHKIYEIEERAFAHAIFDNARRAFKLLK